MTSGGRGKVDGGAPQQKRRGRPPKTHLEKAMAAQPPQPVKGSAAHAEVDERDKEREGEAGDALPAVEAVHVMEIPVEERPEEEVIPTVIPPTPSAPLQTEEEPEISPPAPPAKVAVAAKSLKPPPPPQKRPAAGEALPSHHDTAADRWHAITVAVMAALGVLIFLHLSNMSAS